MNNHRFGFTRFSRIQRHLRSASRFSYYSNAALLASFSSATARITHHTLPSHTTCSECHLSGLSTRQISRRNRLGRSYAASESVPPIATSRSALPILGIPISSTSPLVDGHPDVPFPCSPLPLPLSCFKSWRVSPKDLQL